MHYFVWNIDPILLNLGPIHIHWYGLLFAGGFVVGFAIMRWIFRREGKPEADLDPLLLYMMAGTIIGARLGHVLFYDPVYYFHHPLEILEIWKGGLASHGGAIGIFTALYLYARRHPDQPYGWLLDRMAIPGVLGGAFIRIGNFFNSEILGTPSHLPWAVVFARVDNVPRHPVQLYESAAYLLTFAVLFFVYKRLYPHLRTGLLSGLLLVLVFTARFFLEFIKVRQASYGYSFPLSVGQWLSLPFIVLGIVLLIRGLRDTNAATRR